MGKSMTIGRIIGKAGCFIKYNSPTILTGIGAAGVVATAILAAKGTTKAELLIATEAYKDKRDLTTREKIITAAPAYIPAFVTGVTTIVCIFGANVLNKKQQAALASAYALIDASYKEYRGKLKEIYGEQADFDIRAAIVKDKYEQTKKYFSPSDGLEDYTDGQEKVLFYEEFSNRYFESTVIDVLNAEKHLNRNFVMRGDSCLNEFYDFLGLEPTQYGDIVGWTMADGYSWIDFSHNKIVLDDGLEVYAIGYDIAPEEFQSWE